MEKKQERQDSNLFTTGIPAFGDSWSGPVKFPGGIRFSVSAEADSDVSLILYEKGSNLVRETVPMKRLPYSGSVFYAVISEEKPENVQYNYLIDGEVVLDPAARIVIKKAPYGEIPDPDDFTVRAGLLADTFVWGENEAPPCIPYEDVIAYYLHVRGFTKHKNSGVRAKGTFKGVTEKIPYLKDLGVNQIIMMPAYEFDEMPAAGANRPPKLNYWGYTKGAYFAPKSAYADYKKPDAEFKTMVQELHRAGMEVIMEFSFPDTIPGEQALQCLIWWVQEYHVDGFLLLASERIVTLASDSPMLKGVKLISGCVDPARYAGEGKSGAGKRLAVFHDGFKIDCRKLLKGDENMTGSFAGRMKENLQDAAVMNYITSHDGFTLMDLVSYDKKYNEENGEFGRDGAEYEFSWNCGFEGPTRKKAVSELRSRQMKNALAMLFLAQGTPMLMAGDERCNSQLGNNNPYCIDSETTWVDWKNTAAASEMTRYVKQLIAFRKQNSLLHVREVLCGQHQNNQGYPDFSCHSSHAWYGAFEYQNRHVGIMYCGTGKMEGSYAYLAFNLHWDPQEFAVPFLPENMKWTCVFSTDPGMKTVEDEKKEPQGKSFMLPGRTVCVLTAEKQQ